MRAVQLQLEFFIFEKLLIFPGMFYFNNTWAAWGPQVCRKPHEIPAWSDSVQNGHLSSRCLQADLLEQASYESVKAPHPRFHSNAAWIKGS